MPKFLDGYQTSLGSRVLSAKLTDTLNVSVIKDNLLASSLDVKRLGGIYPVFVTAVADSEEAIPLFAHPYLLTTRKGERILATDLRLYLKKKVFDGTLRSLPSAISSQVEFSFARARAILNLEWLEGDVESLKTDLSFSTMMFGRWIADVLSRTFALDARDQQLIAIASTYYYQALFTDERAYDEETLQKWSIHTIKTTLADEKTVKEAFRKMPEIKDVSSLVEGIQNVTENIRLRDLNVVTLLTLVRASWYGNNSKEILAVSLEHPPTWMAIVYAALNERSYRTTLIYKIAERVGKRGIGDDFHKRARALLAEHTIPASHIALASAGLV